MRNKHIAVLGAGPAGAAAALGLMRLGYQVTVISDWRRFNAIEGTSERVLHALRTAGLRQASATAISAAHREVYWAGQHSVRNREWLLERQIFDRALREDLHQAGVQVLEARILGVQAGAGGVWLQLDGASDCSVDFVVEARGRQAPQSGDAVRGPETVSLLSRWRGPEGKAGSAAESLDSGWCWLARLPGGEQYWQWTLDARHTDMPGKADLPTWCAQQRAATQLARAFFTTDPGVDVELRARSSTCTLASNLCDSMRIRIGDAAMAVDPLSGNGIFQSLSSALQAPAVVNTLLQYPADRALAQDFHRRRVTELFYRFARLGRDFYAQVQARPEQLFWRARQHWPDDRPAHVPVVKEAITTGWAPVVKGQRIEPARVVVTPDQPLGIWHLGGVELAPLVEVLRDKPWEQVIAGVPPAQRGPVASWLRAAGYGPDTAASGRELIP